MTLPLALGALLAMAPTPRAVVHVDAGRVTGHVDPRFYGLFTEHLGDSLDWRLPAEKLKGRGFESGDANADGVADPWSPLGAATFTVDASDSMPRFADGRSSRSQRIELHSVEAGIAQDWLAVAEGDSVTVSYFLKGDPAVGPLQFRLRTREGMLLAEATGDAPAVDWERRSVVLEPRQSAFPCILEITATGEGTLRLDQLSALPASAVGAWRRDVVDLYERFRPATLRYPGGNFCQTYHFADGLGPAEMRPVVPSPAWGSYPEPNHIGTDEFLALARQIGAEPILCLNIGDTGGRNTLPDNSSERALRESLQWLEYVNGTDDTRWGAHRAANGHPEPYGVRLWEVGNEIGYGHIHGQLEAAQYAERCREFATALRARDPGLELIACGFDPAWNRLLVERNRDLIDFVAIHVYDNLPMPEDTAAHAALAIGPWLDSHIAALREGGAQPGEVRLALNEWSYSWAHWGGPERAVAAAGLLHECLRRADWVAMTNNSDAVVRFRNNEAVAFPDSECLGLGLLAAHTGREVLATSVAGPTFSTLERGAAVPGVDAVASRGGETLFVSLVNRCPEEVSVGVGLDGLAEAHGLAAWGIRESVLHGRISFESPGGLAIVELPPPPDGPASTATLPPMSVTVLAFRLSGEAQVAGALEGIVSEPGSEVIALPADGGEAIRTKADAQGHFALPAPPGAWRISASAPGFRECLPVPVLATAERPVALTLTPLPSEGLSRLGPELGEWTLATWEGDAGAVEAAESGLRVRTVGPGRSGLLSAPISLAADEALVLEAHLAGYEGHNALLHLTTEGHEGQFREFLELGIERGRTVCWGGGADAWGAPSASPATLRMVIGPRTRSGRTVEMLVNGELVQRARDQAWLADRPLRAMLYGWGEGSRTWDWVRAQRVPVGRRTLLAEEFDALDPARLEARAVVGAEGTVACEGGRVTIHGAVEGRYGLISGPLEQSASEALVVRARLLAYQGTNGLLCLLSGEEFGAIAEAGIERGRAQAWIGDWSRATEATEAPAELRTVIGPANERGERAVRVYVNDRLVSASARLPGMAEPLRCFLYGWGDSTTVWDSLTVEAVDLGDLGPELAMPWEMAG